MKIALIEATSFVASLLVNGLLNKGHQVTFITVGPQTLNTRHANLEVVQADVCDTPKMTELLRGHDAVISAFNPDQKKIGYREDVEKSARCVQEAVKKAGIKRYLVIGGGINYYP